MVSRRKALQTTSVVRKVVQRFGRPGGEARRGAHIIANDAGAVKFRLYKVPRRGWTGKQQGCDER